MELNLEWRAWQSDTWPEVACELRPLKVWAFQEVLEAWEGQRQPSATEGEKPLPAPIKGTPLMTVARRILPEHARNLQGVTVRLDGQSRPATLEQLCEETALMPVAGEILSRLVAISEITEAEQKN